MGTVMLRNTFLAMLACVSISVSSALRTKEQGLFDFFKGKPEEVEKPLSPKEVLGQMKNLLTSVGVSPDCKAIVQECIKQKGVGNCVDDVEDCAKETLLGESVDLRYSNFGPDIDLPGIMQEASTEIGMLDGTGVAKRILKDCLTYKKSSWFTAFEGLISKKNRTLTPQSEFLCRSLSGKDLGNFVDALTAPLNCEDFEDQHALCKERVPRPSITKLFREYFPLVVNASKVSVQSPESVSFRQCWNTQKDRALCVNALFLGRVCEPRCKVAECTYRQMNQTEACSKPLRRQSDVYFSAAMLHCNKLADEMQVGSFPPCKNIDPKIQTAAQLAAANRTNGAIASYSVPYTFSVGTLLYLSSL